MPQKTGVRLVEALNSKDRVGAAIVYSDSTSQGTELLIPVIDAQTNKVELAHVSGRYGKNFVEVGEDTSVLGEEEREAFTHKTDEPFVGTTDDVVEQKTKDKHHKG